MYRLTFASLVCALAAATVLAVSAQTATTMATPKLVGTVGPGFNITLKRGTKMVKTLKAGKYTFVIHDKASIHNFTLKQTKGGQYLRMLTGTSFTGTKTVTVRLKKGTWKAFCSIHPTVVVRFFKVLA
jgi:hypothetical protein